MRQFFVLLVILISVVACQPKGRVYVKHQELSPNLEWLKKDVREFKVSIEDINQMYNLNLTFRYVTGYQYNIAKVLVTEISPSGKRTTSEYDLTIRDNKGNYLGDPALDIWDSEHLIVPNKSFTETGTYTYRIEQNMPVDPLNFAMEIGVIIDIVK